MNMLVVRQGDVIVKSATLPQNAVEKQRAARGIVLAEGEVTGHAHAIADAHVRWFTVADNPYQQWVVVESDEAVITHEEHASVTLPRGVYVVDIQVQYAPGEIRRVLD